jgi:hypothetical protein
MSTTLNPFDDIISLPPDRIAAPKSFTLTRRKIEQTDRIDALRLLAGSVKGEDESLRASAHDDLWRSRAALPSSSGIPASYVTLTAPIQPTVMRHRKVRNVWFRKTKEVQ